MSNISDLTGTTWVLKSSVSALNYPWDSEYNLTTNVGSVLKVDYSVYTNFLGKGEYSSVLYLGSTVIASTTGASGWYPDTLTRRYSGEIKITGGTAATNTTVIEWFEANATQVVYTITTSLTHLTASGDTEINGTATVTLTAPAGYRVPAEITVTGADYTYDDYTDIDEGVITLTNATGNVTITAAGLTEEERAFADLNGIAEVVNEKAGTTGEKYLPQVKQTAKTITPLSSAPAKSGSDLTASGNVVTVPAGYYAAEATKAVGTSKAAATYTPTATDQTIAAGQYLEGAQTVKGVVCSNLSAANVKEGVTVKIGTATDDDSVTSVTGTLKPISATSDATATAADIASGKTAYVNGEKITGTAAGGGGTQPTLFAPSFSKNYGDEYIGDDNGKHGAYYNIYDVSNNSRIYLGRIAKNPQSNTLGTHLNSSDITPDGYRDYALIAVATAQNFTNSADSESLSSHFYSITKTLSHCQITTNKTGYWPWESFDLELSVDEGYALPDSIQITCEKGTVTLNNGVLTYLTNSYGNNGFNAKYIKNSNKIEISNGNEGWGPSNLTIIVTAAQAQAATISVTCDFAWDAHDAGAEIQVTHSDSTTATFTVPYQNESNTLRRNNVVVSNPYTEQDVTKITVIDGDMTGSVSGYASYGDEIIPTNGETITLHSHGD